jgi:hypothetical protein
MLENRSRRAAFIASLATMLAPTLAVAQTTTPTIPQAAAGSVTATAPTTTPAQQEANAMTKPPEPPFVPMVLTAAPELRSGFVNDTLWHDTEGRHINAHGGGVLFHEGVYYWYGEQRNPRGQRGGPSTEGVNCYTSTDLYNWTPAGIVMPVVADESSDITRGCTIERPKVIYNARTKQFVMWFHLELKGRGYAAARTAVAVSDRPTGPFRFIRSLRPNAGQWPINFPENLRTPLTPEQQKAEMAGDRWRPAMVAGAYLRRDFAGGQMARDMTLYVDPDDGKAYHVASAEENFTLNIHELTDDYLDFTGRWLRVTPGGHNEAPAIVKHGGKYHLLASGCTGWAPNDARVLTAPSMWGPWTRGGNPAKGTNPQNNLGPSKTWGGQSTYILPVNGKPNAFIAMFDVWRPRSLIESGYIWLPVEFDARGDMVIRWRDRWDLSVFDRLGMEPRRREDREGRREEETKLGVAR